MEGQWKWSDKHPEPCIIYKSNVIDSHFLSFECGANALHMLYIATLIQKQQHFFLSLPLDFCCFFLPLFSYAVFAKHFLGDLHVVHTSHSNHLSYDTVNVIVEYLCNM